MYDMITAADDAIHPFRIAISQRDLDDLHERLDRTRWPDELPGVGWAYGVPRDYLKELARYWRHDYDWRSAEAELNQWPQYTTSIDGATIHFAHLRSPEPGATPLVMTHGWPGSIVEFAKVVGPLTDPQAHGGDPADAVHLVLPSIPGFGLSGPTTQTGWEFKRVAAAFAVLMERIGYERYGVQGGDWGTPRNRRPRQPRWQSSRRTTSSHYGTSRTVRTTSCNGRSTTAADTSRPWSNRNSSSTTYNGFSGRFARPRPHPSDGPQNHYERYAPSLDSVRLQGTGGGTGRSPLAGTAGTNQPAAVPAGHRSALELPTGSANGLWRRCTVIGMSARDARCSA
jgi:hypothetical protein